MTKLTLKLQAHPIKKRLSNKFFALLTSMAAVVAMAVTASSEKAVASEPISLAQQRNVRVAHVVCSPYDIMIRFTGYNNAFSYQTQGLYLDNGESYENDEGDIVYDFFNGDFKYRVVKRDDGSATLFVFKYGETLLQKSCTWD